MFIMINLPPEIIQIIFLKLCPTKTIFPLRNDPRLLVTHVCSQWRAIALGMPNLWANLCISVNVPPPHDHIRAWISRSVLSTLSVGLYGPLRRNTFFTEIFDLVLPEIHRCASLKLCIDQATFRRLLTLSPGSLRTLRSISVRPTGVGNAGLLRTIPRITAFQQCPWLRRVSFVITGSEFDIAVLELPWNQLTHLNIHSCWLNEYEILNVLRRCAALQECRISTFPSSTTDIQRIAALARPIVLSCLHTLRLEPGHPRGRSIHFVHALCLPRLRRLTVVSWRPCALLPLFQPLLSETVRDLDLSRWTPMDLPAALALVPNLETLTFKGSSVEMLHALGDGSVVPRLVTLRLRGVAPDDLLDMLEARAVASRVDSGISMFINVFAAGEMDMDRLAALRAAGVQFTFGGSF